MKKRLVIPTLFVCSILFAQDTPPQIIWGDTTALLQNKPVQTADNKIYELYDVSKEPQFPGGEAEMLNYLWKNIKLPPMTEQSNIETYFVMQFVVRENGEISDISILRGNNAALRAQFIEKIKAMPRWTPGEKDGKPVAVKYTLPIRFCPQ